MADDTSEPAQFVEGIRAALAIDVAYMRGELEIHVQKLAADAREQFYRTADDDSGSPSSQ